MLANPAIAPQTKYRVGVDQETDASGRELARGRRVRTAPLPKVPARALLGPRTLESRFLPIAFLVSLGTLLVIQAWKVLG